MQLADLPEIMRTVLSTAAAALLALSLVVNAQDSALRPEPASGFVLAAIKAAPATPSQATPAPPPVRATPAPRATPASRATPAPPKEPAVERCANLEVTGIEMHPLAPEERLWSDRPVTLKKVPEKYKGYRFTQHPAHGLTLKFKVLEDGPVVLGCSSRWGSTAEPDVAKDFTTAEKLLASGWVRQVRDEVETSSYDMQFLIFTRQCKAGEEFTLRTDKYAPPILIFK